MPDKKNILVATADQSVRKVISESLDGSRFKLAFAGSAISAQNQLASQTIDGVILDASIPGEDGLALAKQRREGREFGVLLLLPRNSPMARVAALESGADDCLSRPIDPRELAERVDSMLRRYHKSADASEAPDPGTIDFGGRRLQLERRRLIDKDGSEVVLTAAEFEILAVLARNPNRVITREDLISGTFHREWSTEDRGIDVHIGHLRRKLCANPRRPNLIRTVRGLGYIFTPID